MEFMVNASYYISDAVVIFPCLPIILYSSKNDPFIFHWLLIAVSVFILVTADLGYTFVASINDELLQNIEWLNRYFIQPVNSESRKLVYITLFERMWLLEKSVIF